MRSESFIGEKIGYGAKNRASLKPSDQNFYASVPTTAHLFLADAKKTKAHQKMSFLQRNRQLDCSNTAGLVAFFTRYDGKFNALAFM